jgi:hypothetical protein|tara:strand:- start:45 stop:1124 length:1080 start_codon:yes stop_codon:yes gene_type:complete
MSEFDLQTILKKHRGFWNRTEGPLLNVSDAADSLFAPLHGISITLADGSVLSDGTDVLTADMIDPSAILDVEEYPLRTGESMNGDPLMEGDLFVTRAPIGKMVWVEAVLGCPVVPRLDTGSIYSAPFLKTASQHKEIGRPEDSPWFKLLAEYTRQLIEDSGSDYQVVQCLQRGPIDLVSAILGHSAMCIAIYDDPENLRDLAECTAEAFIKTAVIQQSQVPTLEGGYTNPFGIWSPGTVVRTQADVVSSVSAQTYRDIFFPWDKYICEQFDYSIIHLHSGYLHHVEVVLEDPYPTAVQVSLDTGSTPFQVNDLIPIFKRILEVKPLIVMGDMTRDELNKLLDNLPHNGLCISPWAFEMD